MLSLAQNYITRGFWGDEAWTSLISQLPYLQMLRTTAADFHPPAYYTVVELWYKIFPPTEVSTRLVSVIFYLLTAYLVYKIVITILRSSPASPDAGLRLVFAIAEERKRFWGLISAVMVAVNPIFFQYAFEARNYTMFAFAATGSVYFLIKILNQVQDDKIRLPRDLWSLAMTRNGIGFVLFTTLGIYTHYYMFFTLAAQGLFILIWERKFVFKMIGVWLIVAILYLPWIPFLLGQVSSVGQSYWIGGIGTRTHYEAILRLLGGEQQNVFRPILFWLATGLVLVGLWQHLRQKSFEKPYILIWLWATVPFILATLPGLKLGEAQLPFRPIFFWRYLIGAAVPLSMVLVHAAQKLQAARAVSLIAVITLSLVIDYSTLTRYPNGFKQVYENEIVGKIGPDDNQSLRSSTSSAGLKIVTVLPSFAEVLYYRNRFGLGNELVVLPEGLVAHSGKSLLDAYVENGVVKIGDKPEAGYFEMRPGPSVKRVN